jgi:hypothetical protein
VVPFYFFTAMHSCKSCFDNLMQFFSLSSLCFPPSCILNLFFNNYEFEFFKVIESLYNR